MTKKKPIKLWAIMYKKYFVQTYKTKKEAETAIRPDPKGYKIFRCEVYLLKPKVNK